MHKVSAEQRRQWLWRHHFLGGPAAGAEALPGVAKRLVGIHSTDPVSVFLGFRARVADLFAEDVEEALYETRSVVRKLGMRRTMFVTPSEYVPLLHNAVTAALAPGERRRSLKLLAEGDITDRPDAWFDRVAEATVAALRRRGEATAVELTEDVPELGQQIEVGKGKKWGGKIGMSTRILFWLATTGRILRARPLGSWKSTMYRWTRLEDWLGLTLQSDPEDETAARVDLAKRYLRAFGPVTFEDLQWWTGWTKTATRAALEALQPVEVDLGGEVGLMVDEASVDELLSQAGADGRRVALLPALDSTTMGWKGRDWYLGGLDSQLFDRNGNAGPTVWEQGRVVGGWAQREDGEIAFRLLTDVGQQTSREVEREASRLAEWLGDVRFVPRFRTPLEKELTS